MLRIERSGNGQVLFTLSGRIEERRNPRTPATARLREIWTAADFQFAGRDACQPGRREISSPVRGTWHQARQLSTPRPNVDR